MLLLFSGTYFHNFVYGKSKVARWMTNSWNLPWISVQSTFREAVTDSMSTNLSQIWSKINLILEYPSKLHAAQSRIIGNIFWSIIKKKKKREKKNRPLCKFTSTTRFSIKRSHQNGIVETKLPRAMQSVLPRKPGQTIVRRYPDISITTHWPIKC